MSEEKDPQQVPLALIGIGCLFPKADGLAQFWSNIKGGVDAIGEVPPTHWSAEDYFDSDPKKPDLTYARRGGFLDPVEFDPAEFGISPNTLEATDSAQLLGLVAAGKALSDAGYGPDREFDRSRVSVILGVTGTLELVVPLGARLGHPIWRRALAEAGIEGEAAEKIIERIKDGYVPWQENSFPGLLGNVVAGRIANRFNLGGTNCVVDAACASSLSAAHLASLELGSRRSSMVVTGGVDCFNDIFMYMCFSKTPALSPTGDARPFDQSADGTILGEGLGMVVLKRLDDAERDGDRIYAVLKGVGSSSDGRGKSIYAPSAQGQTKALSEAYRVSGFGPETVGLVEAHGTGTTVGDAAEVEALTEVYRKSGREGAWCALGSVKSMVGHTKAAAGSAGMIKAALSLYHKVLPPTIKVTQPIAPLAAGDSPFYLNTELRPWLSEEHPRRAAVSALGFGGSNFHVVLEEHRSQKAGADWDGVVQLVALSGPDRAALSAGLAAWSRALSWEEVRVEAARSRAAFRREDACRLLLVLERGKSDPQALAAAALSALASRAGQPFWSLPDGVYFGSGAPGKLAVLFPGQGSQYVGMGRDLACRFPEAHSVLSEASAAYGGERRLSDLIHPRPVFAAAAKTAQEADLRATQAAQPALGAASLAAWRVLSGFGLSADAFAGHSYGELTALCAAGRIDATTLFALSEARGRLMAEGGGDRGGMLAVQAPLAEIEAVLKEEKLELVVANKNAPLQSVLSGKTAEIERAAAALTKRGLKNVALPVSAAFHSPLVAGALAPFRAALENVPFTPGAAVYADKTAAPYPAAAPACRDLLASQLASPVEFVALLERLHADGMRTFIEVGPGARLTGLAQACLGERAHAFAIDASSGRRAGCGDLARALAQLSAAGHSLRLDLWEGGEEAVAHLAAKKKPRLSVKLTGANYRSTKPAAPKPYVAPRAALPTPAPVSAPAAPQPLLDALRATQESLVALQRMQEQAASLHVRFLEGQEAAQQSFQALVEQQQRLFASMSGAAPTMPVHHQPSIAVVRAAAPEPARPQPPGSAPTVTSELSSVLLGVVSEKTGYPVETLNPDMDLESDLGIDSIKRVEILSALQEKVPNAPKVKPEHLGTLRTLRQIADFLSQGQPSIAVVQAPAPQAARAQPPASAAAMTGQLSSVLLEVVSEKTGYPVETLNPDMDLESDLGIDSIKRVEILSALQEKVPNAPKVKPEHLGTLRTLRQIADFLSQGQPSIAVVRATAPEPARPQSPSSAPTITSDLSSVLLKVVSEKTGYPVETLNPDMDLESDLGIDSIKRVEILSALQEKAPDAPKVKPEHLGTLRTLRQIGDFLSHGQPSIAVVQAPVPQTARAQPPASAATFIGAVPTVLSRQILKALDFAPTLPRPAVALDPALPVWVAADDAPLQKALIAALGRRGLRALPAERTAPPLLGALVIVAPVRKLKPGALWGESSEEYLKKALILAKTASPGLRAAGKAKAAAFMTVSRLDGSFGLGGLKTEQDPVLGGLAGLAKTAAKEWPEVACRALDAAADWTDAESLAEAVAGELGFSGPLELGLTARSRKVLALEEAALESGSPSALKKGDVVLVTGGARGVTGAAAEALARSCAPTLVLLGRTPPPEEEPAWLSTCRGEAEIQRALLERAPGRKASPKELAEGCRAVLAAREVRDRLARLNAAGAQAVYVAVDVRDAAAVARAVAAVVAAHGPVRGLIHGAGVLADKLIADKFPEQAEAVFDTKVASLRHLLEALDLRELKAVAVFSSSTARFGRSGQSDYAMANEALNKAAQLLARRLAGCRVAAINWGPWDGGMVTPGLKALFEREGVAVIPLEAGAAHLAAELSGDARAVETVVLGAPPRAEGAKPAPALRAAFERSVSVEEYPFLQSHVINGKAVLPFAFIVEWLGHAALHGNPGLVFHGFEDMRILKGVLLNGGGPYPVEVRAGKAVRDGAFYRVPVELRGAGEGVLHASARVVLAARLPEADAPRLKPAREPYAHSIEKAYRDLLFHGPDLRGLRRIDGMGPDAVAAEASAALPPKSWARRPWRDQWLADPLAIDAAFQAMILWSFERSGAGSLPSYAAAYRQFRARFPEEGVRLLARVVKASENHAVADIEFTDFAGVLVARLEGYECTIDRSLNAAFRRNVYGAASAA